MSGGVRERVGGAGVVGIRDNVDQDSVQVCIRKCSVVRHDMSGVGVVAAGEVFLVALCSEVEFWDPCVVVCDLEDVPSDIDGTLDESVLHVGPVERFTVEYCERRVRLCPFIVCVKASARFEYDVVGGGNLVVVFGDVDCFIEV